MNRGRADDLGDKYIRLVLTQLKNRMYVNRRYIKNKNIYHNELDTDSRIDKMKSVTQSQDAPL